MVQLLQVLLHLLPCSLLLLLHARFMLRRPSVMAPPAHARPHGLRTCFACICSLSTYFFTDFRRLCVLSSNAAPTSGYRCATTVRIDDSEACVDGGDMSPDDIVSPRKPETFGASGDASVRFDVDATAFDCMLAYFDRMTVG